MRDSRHPSRLHMSRLDWQAHHSPVNVSQTRPNAYSAETNIARAGSGPVPPIPGWTLTKMEDVVSSFVSAATDPAKETNFSAYIVPVGDGVYRSDATGNL